MFKRANSDNALDTQINDLDHNVEYANHLHCLKGHCTRVAIYIMTDRVLLAKIRRKHFNSFELVGLERLDLPAEGEANLTDLGHNIAHGLAKLLRPMEVVDYWLAMPLNEISHRVLIPKVDKKNLEKTVFWAFKKETGFIPSSNIFDYEVGEVLSGNPLKIAVNGFAVSNEQLDRVHQIERAAKIRFAGLTLPHLAVQNFCKLDLGASSSEEAQCSIYVGRQNTHVTIYRKQKLYLSRMVKFGMVDVLESVESLWGHISIAEFYGRIQLSEGFEEVKPAIQECLKRLVAKVERTLEFYAVNYRTVAPEKIVLLGCDCFKQLKSLFNECSVLELAEFTISDVIKINDNTLDLQQNCLGVSEVCGLAMSDCNHTVNFLLTEEDKKSVIKQRCTMVLHTVLFSVLLLICGFIWFKLAEQTSTLKSQISQREKTLQSFGEMLTIQKLDQRISEVNNYFTNLKKVVKKSPPAAVLTELAVLAGPEIKLTHADFVFFNALQTNDRTNMLELNGYVVAPTEDQSVLLGDYLLRLEASPLFSAVRVKSNRSKRQEVLQEGALNFNLNVSLTLEK